MRSSFKPKQRTNSKDEIGRTYTLSPILDFDAEVMPEKVSILFGAENWTQTVKGENARTNDNRSIRVVSV